MEQILIQIKSKEKAKILRELLESLDFVELVESNPKEYLETDVVATTEFTDFFAMAGLWEGRDVTVEEIRQQAWPR